MSSGLWSKQTQAGVMASVLMSSSRSSTREVLHLQIELAAQLLADQLGIFGEEEDALAGSEGDDGGWFHRSCSTRGARRGFYSRIGARDSPRRHDQDWNAESLREQRVAP